MKDLPPPYVEHIENMRRVWEQEANIARIRLAARSEYLKTHPQNFLDWPDWLVEFNSQHPELMPPGDTE